MPLGRAVGEEFRAWIDAMLERFTSGFKGIEDAARAAMEAYHAGREFKDAEQEKAFALWVMEGQRELAPLLFAMSHGRATTGYLEDAAAAGG